MTSRDREATEQQLIDALGEILVEEGFGSVGVNRVAREAGVDKVLIYRYFGGLSGLLQAFAERSDFWPSDNELVDDLESLLALAEPQRWARVAANALVGLRRRPLAVAVLAGELVARSELTAALEQVREEQFVRLARLLGDSHVTYARAAALAVAAGSYLLVRSRHIDSYAGMDLGDDAAWAAIENLLASMVASV